MLKISKYFTDLKLLFNTNKSVRILTEEEINSLDKNKINELKKHKDLLNSLNEWIMIADRNLLPDILKLAKIIKNMEKQSDIILYRGFSLNSFQEDLNLTNPKLHGSYKFTSLEKPVSFSKSKDIAQAFGHILIETRINNKYDFLVITNELNFLIHEMRNLKIIETQEEVILLPPFQIDFKVINIL